MDTSIKSQPNLYETLGLTPAATEDDISDAYAARLRKLRLSSDEARELISAYKTLSNPEKRMAYDASHGLMPAPHAEEDQSEQQAEPNVVPFIAANDRRPVERRAPEGSPKSRHQQRAKAAAGPAVGRSDEQKMAVAAAQGYSLGYFARKHNLSREQARELIERVGHDRDKLNAAAEQLKAAPAPAAEPKPVAAPEPSPAIDQGPAIEPSETPPEAAESALSEQASWRPAYDESSERKGFPAAAKVGAGLLGVGLLATAALLLSGRLDRTDSSPRPSSATDVRAAPSSSSPSGAVTPQTIPTQETSQPPTEVAETPSETPSVRDFAAAPTAGQSAAGEQATPPAATAGTVDSQAAPSNAPEVVNASPAAPAASAPTASVGVLPRAPAPATAGAATVTQALRSPLPPPNVRVLPKLQSGGIGARDNPGGKLQGIVNVQFTVERNGQVTGCKAAASSGNSVIDARTCQLVEQRLRFSPAEDAQGHPVSWPMSATYIWGTKKWRTKR